MRAEDPYQKAFDDIAKAFTKLRDMILWIAKRTLSAKDFEDFVNEFTEKADSKIWKEYNDGWFTYFVNKKTGEKKYELDEGDVPE